MYGSVKGVCNVCVCVVSCTQALSTVLFRCRLVAVVVLAPVWTVSWPETLTVSGTELQPSVSPCLQLTQTDPVKTVNQTMWLGGNVKLQCPPTSNLAETHWVKDSLPLPSSPRNQILRDSLLILNASASDTGRYRCLSLERSHSGKYTTTVAEYQLRVGLEGLSLRPEARTEGPSLAVLQVSVAFLAILLAVLLGWNLYKGHLPLPGPCGRVIGAGRGQNQEVSEPGEAESKALVSGEGNCTSNNNHSTGEEGEGEARVTFPSLQFIDDESEI
ncbi:unnamed protein product [Oncorhynchus mykiss]|uniref:Ig-like domain-containing protein n=1 Tax=Oncorhynchus mykiss TaxID=8022 RepID=A0A060XSF4_ONCMY|nr:unnamed protein product [Oncorhynchus mykiss]